MRARSLIPWGFALALLMACSAPGQRRLQGRWFGHSLLNVDAEYLAAGTAWARGTSFEFNGSNVTVSIPTALPRTAPYEVVKQDEGQVTIAVLRPDGQKDVATFVFASTDQLYWQLEGRRAIVMQRAN